jgi:hypothetical protein
MINVEMRIKKCRKTICAELLLISEKDGDAWNENHWRGNNSHRHAIKN